MRVRRITAIVCVSWEVTVIIDRPRTDTMTDMSFPDLAGPLMTVSGALFTLAVTLWWSAYTRRRDELMSQVRQALRSAAWVWPSLGLCRQGARSQSENLAEMIKVLFDVSRDMFEVQVLLGRKRRGRKGAFAQTLVELREQLERDGSAWEAAPTREASDRIHMTAQVVVAALSRWIINPRSYRHGDLSGHLRSLMVEAQQSVPQTPVAR